MHFASKRLVIAGLPLIALQWAALAHAQDVPADAQDRSSDIVVIGEIARNRVDIEEKREHDTVYSSMSADDIAALPDISVADSFKRLPGVTGIVDAFSNDFDSGVTSKMTVRGLSGSYNLVTFDGLVLATTGGSRDVGLGNFPSTAGKRIEVTSSFRADINGEASGGYFNVVSRSAYDSRKNGFFNVNGSVGYNGPNRVPDFNNPDGSRSGISDNIEGIVGKRFGSSQQFGIVATGVFRERRWDTETFLRDGNSVSAYDVNGDGTLTDTGIIGQRDMPGDELIANPTQLRLNTYSNYQKQYGGSLKLEYKPSSNFYSYIYGLYYRKEQHTVRNAFTLIGMAGYTNSNADDGTWNAAQGSVFWIDEPIQYVNSLVAWHADWEPAENHQIAMNAGWSTATQDQQYTQTTWTTTAKNANLGGSFDQDSDSISYTLNNPAYMLTPANWSTSAYTYNDYHQAGITKTANLDYGFNQDRGDHGFGFKVGASFIDMIRKNGQDTTTYNPPAKLVGNALTLIQDPHHLGGTDYGALYVNPDAVIDSTTWTAKQSGGPVNYWRYEEYDTAAYGMVTWRSENLRANAGLRYERTVQTSNTFDTATLAPDFRKGRYDVLLPSATLLFYPVEGLRLRASFSKTIGRPTPNQVSAPGATKETIVDGDVTEVTVTGGNPDLRPMRVHNYDIGVEYFWDHGDSMASIILFQKNISGNILNIQETSVIDGTTYIYSTPHNGDDGRVRGVIFEVTRNQFAFLPGLLKNFGGTLNGTFTDAYQTFYYNSGVYTNVPYFINGMQNQSKWAGNATLFYQLKNQFQARISYNYRSGYIYAFTPLQNNRLWTDAYGQLDLGLRYNLKKNIVVSADARNLTNSNYRRSWQYLDRMNQNTNYGQTFTFGISAKLN